MIQVTTEYGILEGVKLKTVTDESFYYSFKGIPFAAPPLGKFRFIEPQPLQKWTGVRKAVEHGPKCPQVDIFTGEFIPGSEDCLYLNVYTPDVASTPPLPVMVFIHGGGLKSGSGNDDFYGPDFLVDQGIVLVTINYRLEVFGFLCLDTEEVPGNAGFKDQVAALKWVKQNIANFGGDPNNITIFGESAGALSTALHIISPLSKGLFQRAIIMSGSPFCDWALSLEPKRRAFTLGKQLGLNTDDPAQLLDFLQNVSFEKLVNTNPCILQSEQENNFIKMYHFTMVVEKILSNKTFLPDEPYKILKSGNINAVDVMMGYTSEELIIGLLDKTLASKYLSFDEMFVPRRILYNNKVAKILQIADQLKKRYLNQDRNNETQIKGIVRFWSHTTMTYPIQKLLTILTETGKCKMFFYKFSCVSERNVFGKLGEEFGITGASHLDDLLYLFNAKSLNQPVNKDKLSYKMVQQFCRLFTNFAKYGNPTPSSMDVTWPEYQTGTKAYLDIDETLTTGTNLDEDVIKFWDKIYEDAGVLYSESV